MQHPYQSLEEHGLEILWIKAVPVSAALGAAEGAFCRGLPSDSTGFGALQSDDSVLDFPGVIHCMPCQPPHEEAG
jgi:hypothetical protein